MNLAKPMLTLLKVPGQSNHHLIGTHLTVKKFPAVIGRGQDATIVIKHRRLSRLHCRLFLQDKNIFVKDLGSTNGTYINGKRVSRETIITPGSRINVGGIEFLLSVPMEIKEDDLGRAFIPTGSSSQKSSTDEDAIYIPANEESESHREVPTDHFQQNSKSDQRDLPGKDDSKNIDHANKENDVQKIMEKFQLEGDAEPANDLFDSQDPLPLLETIESGAAEPDVIFDPDPIEFSPSPSPAESEFKKKIEENPAKLSEEIQFTGSASAPFPDQAASISFSSKPKKEVDPKEIKGISGKGTKRIETEEIHLQTDKPEKPKVSEKELGNFFIRRKKKD